MFSKYKIIPNKDVSLKDFSPDYEGEKSKKELAKETKKNIEELMLYQQKLYAESKQALLIVLQALDAGGKDGTIRKTFGRLNPQGCKVTSFKAPTKLELSHDFLWRVHREVPKKGMIGIFNRSHYEDVLIVKVHDWIDDKTCKQRYSNIVEFEKLLSQNGTRILKFFLYISKDEQKKRFQERLDIKEKMWKFSVHDLEERKLWDKYITQFEDVFKHTSTDFAPWYVVPANNKPYRNLVISTIVKETMKEMNPQFPPPEKGLEDIVIE